MRKVKDINFKVTEQLGRRSLGDGWYIELNYGSWNNRREIYDLRCWNENHTDCSKGLTLATKEEYITLIEMIKEQIKK